ncbi:MAG: DUF4834 family protein [Prevotella sp.]|nr:DUF4834 family protein [Prevotella sp.]
MLKFLLLLFASSVFLVFGAILYFVWWVKHTKRHFDRLAQGQQAQQQARSQRRQHTRQSTQKKKIIAEDEGEYVDFEEEK